MPPAFVLSQDQTLMFISRQPAPAHLHLHLHLHSPVTDRGRRILNLEHASRRSGRTRQPAEQPIDGTRPSRSLSRDLSRNLSIKMRDGDLTRPSDQDAPNPETPSSSKPDQQNPPPTPSPRPPAPRSRRESSLQDPVPTDGAHRTRRPRIPSSRLSTMSNSQRPENTQSTNKYPPAKRQPAGPKADAPAGAPTALEQLHPRPRKAPAYTLPFGERQSSTTDDDRDQSI